ncbi:MAG: methionine--tRNA ligase [Verrucomicrobiota bacterium]
MANEKGKSIYYTTAIDYVNGRPHLGHAYEKVMTDVLVRFQRQRGRKTYFLTGTDEHGQKVQQSAEKQGRSTEAFCDEMSGHFRTLYDKLGVSYDDFVRTTQDRHKQVVRDVLTKLYDKEEIYAADYEGYYSTRQEQFLQEKDRVDGKFPDDFGEVVHLKEKNYFFKLSQYQDWLVKHLQDNPDWIFPSFRTKEVLGALDKPIPDLCISRPKARLEWGIPLPFDEEQVTYVWFDALLNYISVIGYGTDSFTEKWPGRHVIGKDIMVPAHAIYWPIMLKASGVELPEQLIVHGWWTQRKEKMSKSVGNVVDPLDVIQVYGVDAFRYFVMREMALGHDADFTPEQFHQRYESELAGNVGNLLNRSVSMMKRYRKQQIPQLVADVRTELDDDLEAKVIEAVVTYREHMEKYAVHTGLTELWRGFQRTNQYVEENAPWKLAKDEAQSLRLDYVLGQLVRAQTLLLSELAAVMPHASSMALTQLGQTGVTAQLGDAVKWPVELEGHEVGSPEPLFPRVELEEGASASS